MGELYPRSVWWIFNIYIKNS